MTPVLVVGGLNKRFGGVVVTQDVSMSVEAGEIHALIGPNGAGKTTLLNQIGGQLRPDSGSIRLLGADISTHSPAARARLGLHRTFQVPRIFASFDVQQNPAVAAIGGGAHRLGCWRALAGIEAVQTQARSALALVGLAPSGRPARELSHGDRRLLEIAMMLVARPKIVLLDEPMAGLGHDESQRMIDLLRRLGECTAMILVEHDMDAVFRLARRITVLVGGRIIACGTAAEVRADAGVRAAYLGNSA